MADRLLKTVKPSGGDYTSLEACMNDNEQNLVTADKYFDVEISGEWSSADTTAVTVHNYTTDATRYINIYTTGDARHSGKVGTGYTLNATMYIDTAPHTKITGMIFETTGNVGAVATAGVNFQYSSSSVISKCIVKASNNAIGCAYGLIVVHNTVFYGTLGAYGAGFNDASNNASLVLNCVTWNFDKPTRGSGTIVRNSFEFYTGISTRDTFSGSSANSYNNATSRASTLGSDSITDLDVSDELEDYANGDASLKSGSNLINAGADLGSDYNTDIIGTSRPQGDAWDIGAFEYVSAEVATIKRRLLMGCGV